MSDKINHRQRNGAAKRGAPKRFAIPEGGKGSGFPLQRRSAAIRDVPNRSGAGTHQDARDRRTNNPNRRDWDVWEP